MPSPITETIIENELLFYVRNKIHSTPKDAIIDSCAKFYCVEEVSNSVSTLEDALGARLPKRNKTEKSDPVLKTLSDIYDKLWSLTRLLLRSLVLLPTIYLEFLGQGTTQIPSLLWNNLKCRFNRLESSVIAIQSKSIGGSPLSTAPTPLSLPPHHPVSPSAPAFSQMAPLSSGLSSVSASDFWEHLCHY